MDEEHFVQTCNFAYFANIEHQEQNIIIIIHSNLMCLARFSVYI